MRDIEITSNLPFMTLTEALQRWHQQTPDAPAIGFLKGDTHSTLSYAELDQWAREIAFQLSGMATVGTRVVLGFEQEPAYVAGFLGCVYAGMIAITSAPPDELRRSSRLADLLSDSGSKIILTNAEAKSKFDGLLTDAEIVDIDTIESGGVLIDLHQSEPSDLMFLQYTSGSTSAPKGVMITHGSLAANLKSISDDMCPDGNSVHVSWLPLYHDMGLIFLTLSALYEGRVVHLMTPAEFLRRPDKWLRAISDLKGTLTAAPNFAYRMCVDRVSPKQMEGLDLSSVDKFMNGSEPVSLVDMQAFYDKFKVCGLKETAAFSGYGMAEVGVYACCSGALNQTSTFLTTPLEREGRAVPGAGSTDAVNTIVPCGLAKTENLVTKIVEPQSLEELPDGTVGEIWLSGPSVGAGYWKKPEASMKNFDAVTNLGAGPFLRTGDLGFLHDNRLYVSGRLKEMMIIRGRNVFPSDVCSLVENVSPEMRGRRAAAFSVPSPSGEDLVVICAARVSEKNWRDLAAKISAELGTEMGILPKNIVFVSNRDLERTTSGKVQHSRLRASYMAGTIQHDFSTIPVVGEPIAAVSDTPADANTCRASNWLSKRIGTIVCDICEAESVAMDRNIFELGLDSLRGVQLIEAIETQILGSSSSLTLSRLAELKTLENINTEVARLLPSQLAESSSYLEMTL